MQQVRGSSVLVHQPVARSGPAATLTVSLTVCVYGPLACVNEANATVIIHPVQFLHRHVEGFSKYIDLKSGKGDERTSGGKELAEKRLKQQLRSDYSPTTTQQIYTPPTHTHPHTHKLTPLCNRMQLQQLLYN